MAFFGVAMLSLGAIMPPLVRAVPEAIGLPMYMSIGIIIGTVIFGPVMDRYGYKWLLVISSAVMLAGLLILLKTPHCLFYQGFQYTFCAACGAFPR